MNNVPTIVPIIVKIGNNIFHPELIFKSFHPFPFMQQYGGHTTNNHH